PRPAAALHPHRWPSERRGPCAALIAGFAPAHVTADMACGAHTTLDHVEAIGARPIIPKRSQMTRARDFDPEKYKRRNMIERSIGKLKQLRRIATRYDRLSESCLACASTCFAGILVLNVATAWLFGHDGRRYRRRAMVICLQTKLIPFPGLPRP